MHPSSAVPLTGHSGGTCVETGTTWDSKGVGARVVRVFVEPETIHELIFITGRESAMSGKSKERERGKEGGSEGHTDKDSVTGRAQGRSMKERWRRVPCRIGRRITTCRMAFMEQEFPVLSIPQGVDSSQHAAGSTMGSWGTRSKSAAGG